MALGANANGKDETRGGILTHEEAEVLAKVRMRFASALEQETLSGSRLAEIVQALIHEALPLVSESDPRNRELRALRSAASSVKPGSMRTGEIPLSQREREYIQDSLGFIDFVERNGLEFDLAVRTVAHDLLGIMEQGTVDQALDDCFLPKVAGYREYTPESVGDPGIDEDRA
jgi:hypothetical protein